MFLKYDVKNWFIDIEIDFKYNNILKTVFKEDEDFK
jgi:hypothetical protein